MVAFSWLHHTSLHCASEQAPPVFRPELSDGKSHTAHRSKIFMSLNFLQWYEVRRIGRDLNFGGLAFAVVVRSALDRFCERMPLRLDAWVQESLSWSCEDKLQRCLNPFGSVTLRCDQGWVTIEAMRIHDVISLTIRTAAAPVSSCAVLG